MSYPSFGGFARSKTARAQSSPCSRTLAFRAAVMRKVCRSVRALSGGAGGLPGGRLGCSMTVVYGRQKQLARPQLLADNNCTDKRNSLENKVANDQRLENSIGTYSAELGWKEFTVRTNSTDGRPASRTTVRSRQGHGFVEISIESYVGISGRAKYNSVRLHDEAAQALLEVLTHAKRSEAAE